MIRTAFLCDNAEQILLANKGYFRNREVYRSPAARADAFRGPGNYGETVAILGCGRIGRHLIALLRPIRRCSPYATCI